MKVIDLTQGMKPTEDIRPFLFPGGEVHFKMNPQHDEDFVINTRLNSSDSIILLCQVVEALKDKGARHIEVFIPYMPYQQADRDFSNGDVVEPFALKTFTNILNNLPVNRYTIFDAHSDVAPALLKNSRVIDNSEFISDVIRDLQADGANNLTLLSPDAGAYKKIGKLAAKIGFKGDVAAANKYRSISEGTIESLELSKQDFNGADILIVDDIAMGGRTFVGLAEKLKEKNAGKIHLAVSHGVFNHGLKELNQHFDRIFTTNSRTNHLDDGDFSFAYDKEIYKLTVFHVI